MRLKNIFSWPYKTLIIKNINEKKSMFVRYGWDCNIKSVQIIVYCTLKNSYNDMIKDMEAY